MIAINNLPLFKPGRIMATPGCLAEVERSGQSLDQFLALHLAGNWGELESGDKAANDEALRDGSRLLSAYVLKTGEKIWIITEAADDDGKREVTTALLPSEY